MSSYASGTTLQNLSLVDDGLPPVEPAARDQAAAQIPPASPAAAAPAAAPDSARRAPGFERYLADAMREFEEGRIEQPLWVRAMDQAGGDADRAKSAYVRARATALRLERRARHTGNAARREVAAIDENERAQDATPQRKRSDARAFDRKRLALFVALLVAVVGAVFAWIGLRPGDPAPPTPVAKTETARPSAAPKAATKDKDAAAATALAAQNFPAKIQELKDAGNWHVLVLYAVEWTRAQPDNPAAWQELASGYIRLRQFEDAQEAARKATQLGPDDYRRWQELGLVDVALNQAVPALAAFEHAVELNPRDVTSLVQIGALRVQQGHVTEARAAYAKALEINPSDTDALCGAAVVARKDGRAKDADAFVRQVAAGGGACPERALAEAAAPPPPPKEKGSYGLPSVTPAPAKSASPPRR